MMRRRNGSLLLEVSLAVMLLAVALIAVAQLLAMSARQRHESRWRVVATRAVANATEQVMALPWAETDDERAQELALHPVAESELPDASLTIRVRDVTEPRTAKRIEVALVYRNLSGQPVDPIRLVAWKFDTGGAP